MVGPSFTTLAFPYLQHWYKGKTINQVLAGEASFCLCTTVSTEDGRKGEKKVVGVGVEP